MSAMFAGSKHRRSLRDWIVDICMFTFAVLFGLFIAIDRIESTNESPIWLFNTDQIIGALSCAAVWFRRRWPVELGIAMVVLTAYLELLSGAFLVILFTIAVHKRPKVSGTIFALSLVSVAIFVVARPDPEMSKPAAFIFGAALQGAVVGWGLFIHNRRRLISSLHDRAARAEAEAQLRADQAQRHARDVIAREMHDVLGHRLSLLSVHAGALEFRPDAPATDISRAAAVIRENSHRALQDLRDVIGVLRAPVGELPQPTMADIDGLIAESADAGMAVTLINNVNKNVPELLGRTMYRIVQEGLTNARRHAAGAAVTVKLGSDATDTVSIEVSNDAPSAETTHTSQTGQGLIGLNERVALAHGKLDFGHTPDGGWQLTASLPWPS